jgi:tetratricopeptide (TPR) repeat protein
MGREVTCSCGNVLAAPLDTAGGSVLCGCGRTIVIPAADEPPAPDAPAAPPAATETTPPTAPPSLSEPPTEIIPPTSAFLRVGRGRGRLVVAALTADAVWIQDAWRLRCVALPPVHGIEVRSNGRELLFTPASEPPAESLTLRFEAAGVAQRWLQEVEDLGRAGPAESPADRPAPEGVALVQRAPDVPHVAVGRLEYTDRSAWTAARVLQLRAGMRGADAVIQVRYERRSDLGWAARCASGLAVRVEDPAGRQRLRLRQYGEEVSGLLRRCLLLLAVQAALLFLSVVFCAGISELNPGTRETLQEKFASAGIGLSLLLAWPLFLLGLAWVLRWPQSLRTLGIGLLAATTVRELTVWLAHLLAVKTTGTPLAEGKLWLFADPVDWAILLMGAVLCARAWRVAGDAGQILPQEFQTASAARRNWSRALFAATWAYVLCVVAFVGNARYQVSVWVLRPPVDPWPEGEATRALDEGVTLYDRGELYAADQSLQRAMRSWEQLTARYPTWVSCRTNLAVTLFDLGLVQKRLGHADEAEKYYARAVALADELGDAPELSIHFRDTLADARAELKRLHGAAAEKALEDKDREANQKYEDAQVKAGKGDVDAERLYGEAVALWEAVVPQAENPDYKKAAVAQVSLACIHMAELQDQQGKRGEAEDALKKAITWGEEATRLDPDRQLVRNNLEAARRMLDGLREQALQERIDKLVGEQRFADAAAICRRGVEDQEEQVRLSADRDAATRRLAYRLDRCAWFLAHCPDASVRDTKEAVELARRATKLQPDASDYQYTLAMVQYRNGAWQDSLASLEALKDKAGGFSAVGWFLIAMNRCRLQQRDEARAALRKGVEWIEEQQRKAEGNALLRVQYEMMRPAIEALRREAENLIQGKDSNGDRVG